ncbi:MAG: HU family DNA-binding protein [Nostoc sp.]|uniref:HU family DNA-binding protein n=1 Tax=Nostoc sp. TaxID=1180 RepID=UPI002FF6D2DA
MNKGELVDAVAAKVNITKKEASEIISAFLSVVTEAVANGNQVTLVSFGSFEPRDRSKRSGRNPKTNEPMGATRFCEVLQPGTYIACFGMRSQLKNQVLLRI